MMVLCWSCPLGPEVLLRHEQQLHALLHKVFSVRLEGASWRVMLDIVPDDDDPHAYLTAQDEYGKKADRVKVRTDFKLSSSRAHAWVGAGFASTGL